MIHTEAEYEAAMEQLDVLGLMDAEPNTPEAKELSALSAEIEAYEETQYPMLGPTPQELAEFRREQEAK